MTSRLFLILLFLLPILSLPARAEPLTLRDATGKEVVLSVPAKRIVSLAPSVTEILFALGLDEEIIGITQICNYPEKTSQKPRIGNTSNPNLEVILSLKPDLVLGVEGVTSSVGIEELRRVGLPVLTLRPRMIDSLAREILLLGRLTAREGKAEELSRSILKTVKRIENQTGNHPPVSVLYLIWHDPMMTVGPDTFIGEILTRAGGEMIGKDLGLGYFRLGMESVLLFNPEVIIIGDEIGAEQIETQREFWQRWPEIRAVRSGRIHFINADLVHRPGPRITEGMEKFAKFLHPELFK